LIIVEGWKNIFVRDRLDEEEYPNKVWSGDLLIPSYRKLATGHSFIARLFTENNKDA